MDNQEQKPTTELIPASPAAAPVSFFMSKEAFEHIQRVATMFSKSDLAPKAFQGNVGNCVIALNMAHRLGADELMVMQNLYIVHGKPAWSSVFLIATLNASGGFSKLKYEEGEEDGGRTRAYAKDLSTNEVCYGAWVSMTMARAEGWVDKNGSKWKTMPEVMRRYRAASFFVKQFAPEVSMGLHTKEEIEDIGYVEVVGDPAAAKGATQKATEDLDRILKNKPIREQITKLKAEQDGLDQQDAKYLTLAEEIEKLESQLQ